MVVDILLKEKKIKQYIMAFERQLCNLYSNVMQVVSLCAAMTLNRFLSASCVLVT